MSSTLTAEGFEASLGADEPPPGSTQVLHALWHAARQDWERAHEFVQDEQGADAAWVHAHLHRVEGDLGNAGYWYRRAGRPMPDTALRTEWREIVTALLLER
jgi:hypothetical protein